MVLAAVWMDQEGVLNRSKAIKVCSLLAGRDWDPEKHPSKDFLPAPFPQGENPFLGAGIFPCSWALPDLREDLEDEEEEQFPLRPTLTMAANSLRSWPLEDLENEELPDQEPAMPERKQVNAAADSLRSWPLFDLDEEDLAPLASHELLDNPFAFAASSSASWPLPLQGSPEPSQQGEETAVYTPLHHHQQQSPQALISGGSRPRLHIHIPGHDNEAERSELPALISIQELIGAANQLR